MVDTYLLQTTGIVLNHTLASHCLAELAEIGVSFTSSSANQRDLQLLDKCACCGMQPR